MFQRRRGSVFAYAITLTALFLTMIVGTMAYFESSNKQATSERWRDVAEQAARSGLDYVIGWGESAIDKSSRLPSSWEMNDGFVMDPVYQWSQTAAAAVTYPLSTGTIAFGPQGQVTGTQILGKQVGEFVLGQIGNYVVTFKARVQQFRFSNDAPRQYRIGVIGRVRKVSANSVDTNEGQDIVSERLLVATLGKEPFSRYAALIDIDAVKNWVPGEEVQGPVHINRGYLDAPSGRNLQRTTQTFKDERSFMKLHNANGPGGFKAPPGKPNYPIFRDRVTMTVFSDGAGVESDDVPVGQNNDDGVAYLSVDNAPAANDGTGMLSNAFLAPENRTSWNGGPGPMPVASPIPLPANSRHRLNNVLGMPPDKPLSAMQTWLDTAEDGLYVPTFNMVNGPGDGSALNYSAGAGNYPSGGIYLRGNVEVMRMTVNGPYSYYLFQLGYGPFSIHRAYVVRVHRTLPHTVELRAFPGGATVATTLAAHIPAGGNLDTLFPGTGANTNSPAAYYVNGNSDSYSMLAAVPTSYNTHPFNGIVFVDCSIHDRFHWMTAAQQNVNHPISGNIYALGDPGSPANPQTKTALFGATEERVSTNDDNNPAAATDSSRLTIVTAGHIFIQNHILLESLYQMGAATWTNPVGDNISLANSRDLIGLVADRQIVVGLCAPNSTTNRAGYGCVVHAAMAALGDPDNLPAGRTGIRAAWGSVTVEGLQSMFGQAGEIYDCVNLTGGVYPSALNGNNNPWSVYGALWTNFGGRMVFNPARSTSAWNAAPTAGGAIFPGDSTQRDMPGNPLMVAFPSVNNSTNNPNLNSRGRLLVFGSVTQKKRGAIGAGNLSYDKDFRYDKRLMTIAPPIFPSSTSISMRVSSIDSPGLIPKRSGGAVVMTTNHDLNFLAVPSLAIATPAP